MTKMEEHAPPDVPQPPKRPVFAWAKEKIRGADLVGVGVNLFVAVLLTGGLVGAFIVKDRAQDDAAPSLNALAARDDASDNLTVPAEVPGDHDSTTPESEDDERQRKGHK